MEIADWTSDKLRVPSFLRGGHRWKRTGSDSDVDPVSRSSSASSGSLSSRRLSQLQLLSGHHIRLDSFRRQHPALQGDGDSASQRRPLADSDDSDDDLILLDLWEDSPLPPPSVQCYAVLREFVTTERAYLEALGAMKSVFAGVFSHTFAHPALTTLYATTLSLHALHDELVSALPVTLASPDLLVPQSRAVIAALRRRLPFFKLYSHYCSSYKDVTTLLQVRPVTLVAPECQAFVVTLCQASRALNVDMQCEMIKPVQRLCRYPLLVAEWLACAPPELTKPLADLLAEVKEVAALVNERVRAEQNNVKLFDLRARLVGPGRPELCFPTRHFISDCHVHVMSMMSLVPWDFWVSRPRTLILLSDMLLVAKPARKHRLKVRKQFAWAQVSAEEIDTIKCPSWDASMSFVLRCQRFDGQWTSMVLKCGSAKHKREVLTLLRSVISRCAKPIHHLPSVSAV
ncbi:hypothetical protein ACHHYP_12567 [Achlya hypogyna]|uniref:DH domain-containing protein n=1 Tax=Achlya hypogyna TaxID=1202772 RepID=A0A1V9YGM0_ACHHY|nr:hypothetical protein ACHHYP_12567 [Achlya hypogyna]